MSSVEHEGNAADTFEIPTGAKGAKGRTVSLPHLLCLVSFSISVNLGINVTFILAPPLFYSFGLDSNWVNIATSVGPILMGVQPILGAWSDNTTSKYGKRRPFIIVGTILAVIGMILFANTRNMAALMNPLIWPAVLIAVSSLILINAGFASIQAASLALMFDNTHTDQDKNIAAAFLSAAYGLASVLGYSIGYVDFRMVLTFFHSNVEAAFYVGLVLVVIGLIPTIMVSNNEPKVITDSETTPLLDSSSQKSAGFRSAMAELWRAFRYMNLNTFILFFAWFMACATGYPWVLFFTAYMGQDVFKGDPLAASHTPMRHSYDEGVRVGSLALGGMGIVTVLSSFACDPLVNVTGYRPLWIVGHLWAIVSVASTVVPPFATPFASIAFCIVGGLYNGIATAVPYALLGIIVGQKNTGLYAGIMNLVNTLAQLVSGAFSGAAMQWFLPFGVGAVAPGIAFCSIWALISLPIIAFVKAPSHESETERGIQ